MRLWASPRDCSNLLDDNRSSRSGGRGCWVSRAAVFSWPSVRRRAMRGLLLARLRFSHAVLSRTFAFRRFFPDAPASASRSRRAGLAVLGGFLVRCASARNPNPIFNPPAGRFFLVIMARHMALFDGRTRKAQVAPGISRGQTVEGLIGGIWAGAGSGALATSGCSGMRKNGRSRCRGNAWSGSGDLAESAMKRGRRQRRATIMPGTGVFRSVGQPFVNAPICLLREVIFADLKGVRRKAGLSCVSIRIHLVASDNVKTWTQAPAA